MNTKMKRRYYIVISLSLFFMFIGLINCRFDFIVLEAGMKKILTSSGVLITDYIALAGIGPAFFSAGTVTLATVLLMYHYRLSMNGTGIMVVGFMAGFAFFGKNLVNMWFMLMGTRLYCAVKKESMHEHLVMSLLSTALGPIVSTILFYHGQVTIQSFLMSFAVGTVIGFVIPSLSTHTKGILNDLSLYNGGFALGLLAMVLCPILRSYGYKFAPQSYWAGEYTGPMAIGIYAFCVLLMIIGFVEDPHYAFDNYKRLLKRPGKPFDDFTKLDGIGATLINMGVCGIIATTYILLIGGQLNGATLGGILSIIGCAARGKHAMNITPIMLGVFIASFTNTTPFNSPALQLTVLFGTTLAPIAGTYGVVAGIVAGFLHANVVLFAGAGYSGANLYNNGFCAGLVSVVMWPMLRGVIKPNTFHEPSPSMRNQEE